MNAAQRLLDDPRLATLFAALQKTGAETRVVGGAVRDALFGLAPHEVDLATTALPDAVLAAARDAGVSFEGFWPHQRGRKPADAPKGVSAFQFWASYFAAKRRNSLLIWSWGIASLIHPYCWPLSRAYPAPQAR